MPRHRPQASGYERITQREEEEGAGDDTQYADEVSDDPFQDPTAISEPDNEYAPIQPRRREHMRMPADPGGAPRRPHRRRTNSGVDIKAINARLERWAEEIKQRFKRRGIKGKSAEEERLEIHHSVFQAPDGVRPATKQSLEADYDDSALRMSKLEFDDIVESVRTAIELGMHPTLISQGSSGSYFARNSGGKVVGVFKPKDEEPYASKNPKWTKWIHRNLFPFAFGRACLIPNLSYVSEAAAYVLDVQLRTNLVPYTDVVGLSSKSFFYDYWDRRSYRRKDKHLPEKQGSFQVFLKGFKGATEFFREHPWPDQPSTSRSQTGSQTRKKRRRWADDCRPGSGPNGKEYETEDEGDGLVTETSSRNGEFWSPELQQSFREQLEKLVILDYIMRNTDRGTDNWMIRVDRETKEVSIVADAPGGDRMGRHERNGTAEAYHRRDESMTASPAPTDDQVTACVGAIDNSLSWPWKHPDAWRSYPFGWLFLPVNLIGRPFTERTRQHFLPLLTSKDWWTETQVKLRSTFEIDVDFKERMFARQMAVMKGQAWNVVETLKTPDHGPLELTRRSRVCVWDDLVDIPVAVPLKRASQEMRRLAAQAGQGVSTTDTRRPVIAEEDEEMDISAARDAPPSQSTVAHDFDLLGPASPPLQQRPTNPFNHSRQNSSQDVSTVATPPAAQQQQQKRPAEEVSPSKALFPPSSSRPLAGRARTGGVRMSYEGPPRLSFAHSPTAHRRRRFSFTIVGRRGSGLSDDDDAGDLGYAAANDLRNVTRRVIVERLEMVKGRPPVFTCC